MPKSQQQFFVPSCAPFLEIRKTLNSTRPYADHIHSAFSVGLILQGKTRFAVGDATYLAEKGDIILIAPGRTHSCNPVDGPRGYYMLLVDTSWLQKHIGDTFLPPLVKDAALSSKLADVMHTVFADQENAVDILAELLLELWARHGRNSKECKAPSHQWPSLNDADKSIHAGGAPLPVSALARAAGMRRESFSRAVRRTTGLPPSRYLHCLRLEKARRLLRQGKSIIEAALAAGYTDQSHFHRMFVKFCAVTPGCYRKSMSQSYKK